MVALSESKVMKDPFWAVKSDVLTRNTAFPFISPVGQRDFYIAIKSPLTIGPQELVVAVGG